MPFPLPLAGGWMVGVPLKVYLEGGIEPETTAYVVRFLDKRSDATFIDIGANVGYYSIIASAHGARVFAFEPDRLAFLLLRINLFLNRCIRAQAFNYAVSNVKGEHDFFISKSGSVYNSLHKPDSRTYRVRTVQTITFDDEYDLCKIDVEGAELEVLEGLKYKQTVICEFFPQRICDLGSSVDTFFSKVQDLNFSVFSLADVPIHTTAELLALPELKDKNFTNIILRGADRTLLKA